MFDDNTNQLVKEFWKSRLAKVINKHQVADFFERHRVFSRDLSF